MARQLLGVKLAMLTLLGMYMTDDCFSGCISKVSSHTLPNDLHVIQPPRWQKVWLVGWLVNCTFSWWQSVSCSVKGIPWVMLAGIPAREVPG